MFVNLRTFFSLGLLNIARVVIHRLKNRIGLNPLRSLHQQLPQGPFFSQPTSLSELKPVNTWLDHGLYFGWYAVDCSKSIPKWSINKFSGYGVQNCNCPCWEISDFDPQVGDIKAVWEASRFDWVLAMAQRAAVGDQTELDRLNNWLSDWSLSNPAYKGPNWKCGQEASIRVMHLAIAAFILGQTHEPQKALLKVVKIHLQRIYPTLSYAIAQDNNHGTSEAAALYIGGSWLLSQGDKSARKYQKQGLKWLENRAWRLIEDDGSFSQYSVNYHRVMLDTYSIVEFWRQSLHLPVFSDKLYKRLKAATNWLYQMTQPVSGDAPNLGANDGARLLPLVGTDYRDYRPSVQLASVLFDNERAYKIDGDWNLSLRWLGINLPEKNKSLPCSTLFENGGYCTLHAGNAFALLNIPNFHFRPSHADALHVDLWLNGVNILCDAGTYCYNTADATASYFGGTKSHNTIQFDHRDQMPRLSRFLFGAWLKATQGSLTSFKHGKTITAMYKDYLGAMHGRTITLTKQNLHVVDKVDGFKKNAVLRWRLQAGDWQIKNNRITNGTQKISVMSTVDIKRFEIVHGWESRYYMKKTSLPVLEVEIHNPGEIVTEYIFN